MSKKRKCPDCPGDIEEDRGPTAKRCKRCSVIRTRKLEAARQRRLRREVRAREAKEEAR